MQGGGGSKGVVGVQVTNNIQRCMRNAAWVVKGAWGCVKGAVVWVECAEGWWPMVGFLISVGYPESTT